MFVFHADWVGFSILSNPEFAWHLLRLPLSSQFRGWHRRRALLSPSLHGPHPSRGFHRLEFTSVCRILLHLFSYEQVSHELGVNFTKLSVKFLRFNIFTTWALKCQYFRLDYIFISLFYEADIMILLSIISIATKIYFKKSLKELWSNKNLKNLG